MEEGGGRALPRDREMEASVSVRERSGDVSGDTASSNNPAGMFTTNLDFTGPVVIKMRMEPVQVAFSLVNKESILCVEKIKQNTKWSTLTIKRLKRPILGSLINCLLVGSDTTTFHLFEGGAQKL